MHWQKTWPKIAIGCIVLTGGFLLLVLKGVLDPILPLTHVDTQMKVVALTFDDGPNPPYTEQFLRLLKSHNAMATFFLLGRNIEMHRNTALRIKESGHELANHGYLHANLRFSSPSETEKEILRTDELIASLGLARPALFRPPFGKNSPALLYVILKMRKRHISYRIAPSPPDYFRSDPNLMARDILERIRPGDIVLLHDGEGIRTETLLLAEKLLTELKARGFRFVTVSELLEVNQDI